MDNLNVRPTREGAFEWEDRDGDVVGALEPFDDHPSIVGSFSLVRDNGTSAGIYVDFEQAASIINWLQAALDRRNA